VPDPTTATIVADHVTWATLLDGVVGAIIGGVLALAAAVLVLRRTLAADKARAEREGAERRELAAEERAADKAAAHAALGVAAAARILQTLADLHEEWKLYQGSEGALPAFPGRQSEREQTVDVVRLMLDRMAIADVPLLHDERARLRAEQLVMASRELGRRGLQADGSDTPQTLAQQLDSFLSFEEYVRRSLAALIHDEPLPPDARPPHLSGIHARERWRAPDLPPLPEV
jgi:hypothetical protein